MTDDVPTHEAAGERAPAGDTPAAGERAPAGEQTATRPCPDCLAEIPAEAAFCRHCGERVRGVRCDECGARNWEEARLCRWCGSHLAGAEEALEAADFEPFTVTARRLPTFLYRGRFLPQRIQVSREGLVVITPGPFNLSQREEQIPWSRVAGFDYHSGIVWDQITIETRGQESTRVGALDKSDGQRIRQVLTDLES